MTESLSRSDDELRHSAQARQLDSSEFQQVYSDFAPGLRASLRARLRNELDVEDCLSRVFEKLWTHGGAIPPAARRAWLFVVARNELALLCRKEGRRPEHQRAERTPDPTAEQREANYEAVREQAAPYDDGSQCAGRERAPLERLLKQEEIDRLWEAGERLSSEQWEVLRCRFIDDLTFREIAERLGIPLGTALTRARSAIKRLRDELNESRPSPRGERPL